MHSKENNKKDFYKDRNQSKVKTNLNKNNDTKIKLKNLWKIAYFIQCLYFVGCKLFLENDQRKIQYGSSYIILKTNATGNIKLIYEKFNYFPDELSINDETIIVNGSEYYLNKTDNIIKLTWYDEPKQTNRMFSGCCNITEIDLSNFNTSQVTDMCLMFYECSSLISLNLSNFDTSQVTGMTFMFYGCSSLNSLDLSNFDTSRVGHMNQMFSDCSSLNLLDLSNFNTSQVIYMDNMFNGCSSLTFLDLSNFVIPNKTIDIFENCIKLEYLNLKQAIVNRNILLDLLSQNIIICSENDYYENLFEQRQFVNCNNNISINNNNKCYSNNSLLENNKHICEICGNNYFKIDNDTNDNNNSFINCYEFPEGYYLDEIDLVYKLCYFSCKTCDAMGNESQHNCITCKDDYKYSYNISYYFNCYMNEPDNIISDIIYNSYGLITDIQEITQNKAITQNKEITQNIEKTITTEITDVIEITDNTYKKALVKNRTELIKSIIDDLFNELNMTEIDNGIDKKKFEKNLIFVFTSTLNQKNNEDKNNITMNLGQCENNLKNDYNISLNDTLYILQIISEEEGMKNTKSRI